MKKGILKISSLLMVFLVLFSTLSFTIEKHICAGKVADVALFGDLERCEMPDENHDIDLLSFKKESCCQDHVQFVQGSNTELKVSKKDQTQVFVPLLNHTDLNLFDNLKTS